MPIENQVLNKFRSKTSSSILASVIPQGSTILHVLKRLDTLSGIQQLIQGRSAILHLQK